MKSYKAFVSSTFVDLKEHRLFVIAALRKAGFFVDPMEDWTAAADEPKRFSQARVAGCDLCILLIARRRGHLAQGERLSITQLEANAAVAHGIPILPFLLDDTARWPKRFDELARDAELGHWRHHWREANGVGFFGAEPSSIEIAPALTRWIAENSIGARDEARARLATKINAEALHFIHAVQLAERGAMPSQQEYDDAYRRWEQAALEIAGELQGLRVDDSFQAAWVRLSESALGLYRLSGTESGPWRDKLIQELQALFFLEATDWSKLIDSREAWKSNESFQQFFAAWWKLRELLLGGCIEFGRRLRDA
jgi:Domain of unknown function (DUF4062)